MKTGKIKIDLLDHYRKLLFYLFNRFKGNNYLLMREYLANLTPYRDIPIRY